MIVLDKDQLVDNPLVTVQVYAYNKEKYIRECLDSVLSQEVNFEYEVIISENPGTDKTREICLEYQKKYPDKFILVLREENMGFFYNYFAAERMSRGKYIARCDADDFWCNSEKLQKQVDFLENNPEYGCCYTRSRILDDKTSLYRKELGGLPWKGFKEELLVEPIQQPTVMYKKELVIRYLDEIKPETRDWDMEDIPRTMWIANHSKIACLDDITAVYRVVENSWSHQTNYERQEVYHKSILDIRLFYYNRYCPGETELLLPLYNDYYMRNMRAAYRALNLKLMWINYKNFKITSIHEFKLCFVLFMKYGIKKTFNIR